MFKKMLIIVTLLLISNYIFAESFIFGDNSEKIADEYPSMVKYVDDFFYELDKINYTGYALRKDCVELNQFLDTISQDKAKTILREFLLWHRGNLYINENEFQSYLDKRKRNWNLWLSMEVLIYHYKIFNIKNNDQFTPYFILQPICKLKFIEIGDFRVEEKYAESMHAYKVYYYPVKVLIEEIAGVKTDKVFETDFISFHKLDQNLLVGSFISMGASSNTISSHNLWKIQSEGKIINKTVSKRGLFTDTFNKGNTLYFLEKKVRKECQKLDYLWIKNQYDEIFSGLGE